MEKELNINEMFEKLIPTSKRKSIFDEDEDYDGLRQYIMSQPRIHNISQNKLPFSEIQLTSYVDYQKQLFVEKEQGSNKHIFYLKQSYKGQKDFCDAAGYYIMKTKEFVVLPYSHIIDEVQRITPKDYGRKVKFDGVNLYTLFPLVFHSPEDAASYVLGQNAGLDEWIDASGKGLLSYYKELAAPKPLVVFTIEDNEEQTNQPPIEEQLPSPKVVLKIKEDGICDASGYFDPKSGNFYILKNSKIASVVTSEISSTPMGKARERLIERNCKLIDGYYLVTKDSKCRTATAAAFYVTGKNVTYVEWESADGKGLKDYYPDRFIYKKNHQGKSLKKTLLPSSPPQHNVVRDNNSAHLFFIKQVRGRNRICDAKGYYDSVTKKFVIMSGSLWSLDVTLTFQYTATEIMRRNAIKKNCKLSDGAYKQVKDVLCDSPTLAASYVTGEYADGWDEWVDEDGQKLKEVFRDAFDSK